MGEFSKMEKTYVLCVNSGVLSSSFSISIVTVTTSTLSNLSEAITTRLNKSLLVS